MNETWFNNPGIQQNLGPATLETIYMVTCSSIIAILFGGLIGIVLVALRQNTGIFARATRLILGFIVNVGRSIPFAILAISLVGFSRMVSGTGSSWQGATVPLAVSAIPYFARLVESNLTSVDEGKVEAAQMMGTSRLWILFGVLVRESIPALIQSVTILVITLVGYSAMAGVVGGGGLGAMAMNYGYYQNQTDAMIIIIVVLVAMVQLIQFIGDMLSRLADHR